MHWKERKTMFTLHNKRKGNDFIFMFSFLSVFVAISGAILKSLLIMRGNPIKWINILICFGAMILIMFITSYYYEKHMRE